MSVTSFFRRVRDFNYCKSGLIAASLGVAPIAQGAAAQTQGQTYQYDAAGTPFTYPTSGISGEATTTGRTTYAFNVTEEIGVEDLQLSLNLFSSAVGKTDIFLTSPAGTRVPVVEYACWAIPVSFGVRNYTGQTIPYNDGFNDRLAQVATYGTPAQYSFSDSGTVLEGFGIGYSEVLADPAVRAACWDRWQGLPDWPVGATNWTASGSFAALPSGTYAPNNGSFASFAGESALGTWTLTIHDYAQSTTISPSHPTYPGDSGSRFHATQIESASLMITTPPPPTLAVQLNPGAVAQGESTTLSFSVDNSAIGAETNGLQFTSTLPAGLEIVTPTSTTDSCGGSLSLDASAQTVSCFGGQVAANGSCVVSVDLLATGYGDLTVTTSDLQTNSGTASANDVTVTVTAQAAPEFDMSFNPNPIEQGDSTALTYSILNASNVLPLQDLGFTHTFSADLFIDGSVAAENTCGGTLTADDATGYVELAGGTVPVSTTCEITLLVTSNKVGAYVETTSALASNFGSGSLVSATLNVTAASEPVFYKQFASQQIAQGEATTLTYTIDNSEPRVAATDLTFTETFATGLLIDASTTPSNTCGGTLTAVDGSNEVTLSGGTVAAGTSCAIELKLLAEGPGAYQTQSGALTSSLGDSGTATATLTVNEASAPIFTKLFDPDEIAEGASTVLTYTIDNSANEILAAALAFSESLPDGLLVDDSVDASSTCGGTLTASSESTVIALEGGSVAAQSTCTIAIGITSATPGTYAATSSALASTLGSGTMTSTGPTAELTVLDVTPPTVEITSVVETFSDLSAIGVTFTFSEDVTGFELSDIVVGNGAASAFEAESATVYTALVTPTGKDDLTVDVPAGAANDTSSSENGNLAAEQLVIQNGIVELTQRIIRNFIAGRMDTIVSNEPDLGDRLTRRATTEGGADSGYAVNYQAGSANISFDTSLAAVRASMTDQRKLPYESSIMRKTGLYGSHADQSPQTARFDIWTKGTWSHSKTDTRRADTGLLYVGADWLLNPDLVVGVLTQFDWTAEEDKTSVVEVEGFGWMAGPYAVQRLAEDLTLEGRVALGQSDNKINPLGLYTDKFDTDRVLVSSQLTGAYEWDRYTIHPFVRAIYMEERQNDYTDTLGNHIGEQTLSLGRLNFGPKIATTFTGSDGTTFSPYATFAGLYDFEGGRVTDLEGFVINEGRLRGRFTGGLNLLGASGWNLGSEMFYDGIGQDKIEAMGFNLTLNLSF